MTGPNPREQAAQRYAAAGWPVFPCQPGEKIPAVRNGFLDATTDPDKISYWWFKRLHANVGITTGASGPDVLGVDLHGDVSGYTAWNRLKREGLVGGPGALVRTPSGGMHAYFQGTDQRNGHIATAGIDFRAAGGYVVAPPSTVSGKPYELGGAPGEHDHSALGHDQERSPARDCALCPAPSGALLRL